jgi:hypothetical protein
LHFEAVSASWISLEKEYYRKQVGQDLRRKADSAARNYVQLQLWTRVHVRTPEQFERWSLVVSIVLNQLCLARPLGQASYRPWETRQRPATPGQVRRMMPRVLSQVGTPARRCQRRGKSPGRALGFHPEPAPRYDVVIKGPKKPSKASG